MASPLALPPSPLATPGLGGSFGGPSRPVNSPGVRRPPASRPATRTPGAYLRANSRADGGVVRLGTSERQPVRLTRRGRLVSVVLSVLMLGAVVIGAGSVADASAPQTQGSTALGDSGTVVVQSGQTLWGIALDVAPDHDPRMVISQIRDLNDLGTRSIVPGQTLIVPTRN